MNLPAPTPLLLVVSAPSGAGKTTLCARLLREFPGMRRVVTCTTRAPREGEAPGRDYVFLKPAEFARRAAAGEFLEQAVVHGACYGTLRRPVADSLRAGHDTLLVIDVQGAARVRRILRSRRAGALPGVLVDVFVATPSLEALRHRLKRRGKDTPAVIERRMRNAPAEIARWPEFRYLLVNDRLRQAYAQLRAIVLAEHCRTGTGRRGARPERPARPRPATRPTVRPNPDSRRQP